MPTPHRTVIRLCGSLRVEIAGQRVERTLPSRQGRLVFAYLALHRDRPVPRDELLGALWPGAAPAAPESLLTALLSRMRRALPAGTLTGRAQLALDLGPDAWVDVEAATSAPALARDARERGELARALVLARDGLEILQQRLLPGLDGDWIVARQHELDDLVPVLLELVAQASLAAGGAELVGAQAAAQQLIRLEPLRESAHALLMEALAARGDVAQALTVYDRLRTRLREELGTVPAAPLRELGDRLLRDEPRVSAPPVDVTDAPPPSNLPPRNPFFVGREAVIAAVADALRDSRRAALVGMPGAGKTQAALEYAERHRSRYRALLWVRADTRDALYSDVTAVARVLGLAERVAPRQEQIVQSVRSWLSAHPGWLLVLDNAEDLEIAAGLLAADAAGDILITTRHVARGDVAREVTVGPLDVGAADSLLLRRAGRADGELSSGERAATRVVCERLGGLALAIDQAGAFIAQTRSSVAEYLEIFDSAAAAALLDTGGGDSVGATLALALRRLREQDEAAAQLLELCAFFAPDAIPEEILTSPGCCPGEPLGDALRNRLSRLQLMRSPLRYSLMDRDAQARTVSVHRLVQTMLVAELAPAARNAWAKRAGMALAAVFPIPDYSNWPLCERLMTHTLACAGHLAAAGLAFPEHGVLLNYAGVYLRQRGRLSDAEPLLGRAREVLELTVGDDLRLAWCLHNNSVLAGDLGRVGEAQALGLRALEMAERHVAPDDPRLTWFLSTLARLGKLGGDYPAAEQWLQRSIEIRRAAVPVDNAGTAWSLQGLGDLYIDMDRHRDAERVLVEALALRRAAVGAEHPHVAWTMASLGGALAGQGRHADARPLLRDALALAERTLGPDHGIVAVILRRCAAFAAATDDAARAADLRARAAAIDASAAA